MKESLPITLKRRDVDMSTVCKTCGNKVQDPNAQRCPRCYAILKQPPKCGDCKGCSLGIKSCSK